MCFGMGVAIAPTARQLTEAPDRAQRPTAELAGPAGFALGSRHTVARHAARQVVLGRASSLRTGDLRLRLGSPGHDGAVPGRPAADPRAPVQWKSSQTTRVGLDETGQSGQLQRPIRSVCGMTRSIRLASVVLHWHLADLRRRCHLRRPERGPRCVLMRSARHGRQHDSAPAFGSRIESLRFSLARGDRSQGARRSRSTTAA
jgi:hypothetical protein